MPSVTSRSVNVEIYGTEAEFMNGTISLKFLGIILSVFSLEVFLCNVYGTLQTRFKPLLLKGGGPRGVELGSKIP